MGFAGLGLIIFGMVLNSLSGFEKKNSKEEIELDLAS